METGQLASKSTHVSRFCFSVGDSASMNNVKKKKNPPERMTPDITLKHPYAHTHTNMLAYPHICLPTHMQNVCVCVCVCVCKNTYEAGGVCDRMSHHF